MEYRFSFHLVNSERELNYRLLIRNCLLNCSSRTIHQNLYFNFQRSSKQMLSNRGLFSTVHSLTPFLLALGGVLTDFLTTQVGLTVGLCEANPNYHPVCACIVFFTVLYLLMKLLPPKKSWNRLIMGIALLSYFGTIHNLLVLLGVFPGLIAIS